MTDPLPLSAHPQGQNGLVEESFIESGELDAAIKRNFPKELLLLMRRQAVDLLLGDSKNQNQQGKSTLQFIKSVVEDRDDVKEVKKGKRDQRWKFSIKCAGIVLQWN